MSFRQYRKIESREQFVVAADTSSGLGDYCAVQFLSKTKIDVPLVYHKKIIATEMTNEIYPVLEKISDITGYKPIVAYERNAGGTFEMDRLASMNRLGKFTLFKMPTMGRENPPDSIKYGWDTNTATRPAMLSQLKEAIDNKLLTIYDRPTIEEMFSFVVVRTTATVKAQAESGMHDDLVMSLAIAWQLYQQAGFGVSTPSSYKEYVQKNKRIQDEDIGI
jgi:hypothetical protein